MRLADMLYFHMSAGVDKKTIIKFISDYTQFITDPSEHYSTKPLSPKSLDTYIYYTCHEDKSIVEVADDLGIGYNTAKSRIRHVKAAIKKFCSPKGKE